MATDKVIVMRTHEISDDVWQQISKGYEVCFDIIRTPQQLKDSFSKSSITGDTLHAMKFDESGNLMGHNYYQPRPYLLNGKEVICALSGGTFVMPQYRQDIFIFNEMVKALDKEAARLGWVALLGVPNENSFKYAVKINKQKHIGDLSYYMLPVNAAKIIKKDSRAINTISSLYASAVAGINRITTSIWNSRETLKPLRLNVSDKYLDIRYDWNNYQRVRKGNMQGVYRIYDEHGIKTAYITFFGENFRRSSKSLTFVVNEILRNEKVDAIMYIGTMNLRQTLLTKVPARYVPQQLPLCVTILDKKNNEIKEACTDLKNIDFGLINFDVR